jgi:hypothetical protein
LPVFFAAFAALLPVLIPRPVAASEEKADFTRPPPNPPSSRMSKKLKLKHFRSE